MGAPRGGVKFARSETFSRFVVMVLRMSKNGSEVDARLARNPGDVIRDFFNVWGVKKAVRLGSDIFQVVVPVIEKPTPLNFAKAGFTISKIIIDDLEVWPEDYFDESWDPVYGEDFTRIVLKALHGKPYKIIRTSDESVLIHTVQVEDVKFGYIFNTKNGRVDRIYVRGDKIARAKEIIKGELWKMMKDSNIILRAPKVVPGSYEGSLISLEVDDAFNPMPSKRADEYSLYLKKCIDAGVTRSVMLYGPPGTGKSTMARTIVNNLGLKSFRIRVEDFGRIETSTIFEAINIFEPDAVILDDFDRTSEQNALLEILEFFQRHVKLVISTVNNKDRLDEAILRPGRFDELVQIKQMDEDVVRSILGEEHGGDFELLKDWPIAFIQEYVKRLRFMNPDEARESVKELAKRVRKLSSYDEEGEDTSLDRVLQSPPPPTRTELKKLDLDEIGEFVSVSKGSFRGRRKSLSKLLSTRKG